MKSISPKQLTNSILSLFFNSLLKNSMGSIKISETSFEIFEIKVKDINIQNTFKYYPKRDNDGPIGINLYGLKAKNNDHYKTYLNKNGDKNFCKFTICASKEILAKKGLYCYIVDNEVKYVGRCVSNFGSRINSGYGNISPRNCYKGGQSTNCHVNSEINEALNENKHIQIGIFAYDNDALIKEAEKWILSQSSANFPWNIQK